VKKVLTIAGSDCSGGAGIQADLKTIMAHKVYGMSIITALTAQNTKGVFGVLDIEPEFVEKQIDAVFSDIYPDAVKIGMVSNEQIIKKIGDKLKSYKAKNIVLDPVMISTSGSKLLTDTAINSLVNELIPLAHLITPNIHEAEALSGLKIESKEGMERAAIRISKVYKGSILIKGGHLKACSDDLLYQEGRVYWFEQENIHNHNTHGTGCTLSSAIACNLASGYTINESIKGAKAYITGALKANLNLGSGSGPLNHCYKMGL
jgi:hydroxymethylpyrimidine/phosphomethylpyrimidine kinase